VAGLKCASYAENLLALDHARRRGFQETLFFNTAGDLCEAAMANVFLVKNGELRTPFLSSGCLPGIARGLVLEIAQTLGIPSAERALCVADLEAADEIFLSSAIRGPVPVSRLDEKCLTPGPVGKQLRGEWTQRIQAELACSAEI
jgi:branched-subunit amino acid aminotransferase/4-amino-4-deoxychorismate lyase